MCFSLLTMYTSYVSQTDINWRNLTPEQQDYFRHLAAGAPNTSAVQYFEKTVPAELQDDPEALSKSGSTVALLLQQMVPNMRYLTVTGPTMYLWLTVALTHPTTVGLKMPA